MSGLAWIYISIGMFIISGLFIVIQLYTEDRKKLKHKNTHFQKGSLITQLVNTYWTAEDLLLKQDVLISELRKYRIKKGITQEELASRIGKSRYYISKVETGKVNLDAHDLIILVEGLEPKHDDLLIKDMV